MKKILNIAQKTWVYILFAALLLSPTIFVKAQSNAEPPKTIESFKIDNTKEECSFTYNLEEATEWMSNITGIKKMFTLYDKCYILISLCGNSNLIIF